MSGRLAYLLSVNLLGTLTRQRAVFFPSIIAIYPPFSDYGVCVKWRRPRFSLLSFPLSLFYKLFGPSVGSVDDCARSSSSLLFFGLPV